jgi:hypothetical protein
MSYKFPFFSSGNKAFANALNALADAAKRHGVNPGGRPGWVETKDGWMPPYLIPTQGAGSPRWTLAVKDGEAGTITISPGTILKDITDLADAFTIDNADSTFTPQGGDIMRIKIEGPFTAHEVSIECDSPWTGYPSAVKKENTGAAAEFSAYHYPLYKFSSTEIAGGFKILSNLYAKRLVGDFDFIRALAGYNEEGDAPFPIPILVPYHSEIP